MRKNTSKQSSIIAGFILLFLIISVFSISCQEEQITAGSSYLTSTTNKEILSSLLPDGFHIPFEAIGKEFILKDHPIYPLKITSSEEIHIFIEAITNTVSFRIEPLATRTASEATITICNLEFFYPNFGNAVILRHHDGYSRDEFKLIAGSAYSFTQDISKQHHTYFIPAKHKNISVKEGIKSQTANIAPVAKMTPKTVPAILKGEMTEDGFLLPFKATGKEFILKDNPIYPLKITSSEEISIVIKALTDTVSYCIEPVAATAKNETTITISGLEYFYPDKKNNPRLFRHQDGHSQEEFKLISKKGYTYTQDISQKHHVYILPGKSTIYIYGNPGDVIYLRDLGYGSEIADSIVVVSDGVTVDGTDTIIVGPGWGPGISFYNSNVTIRNCTISGTNLSSGIEIYYGSSNTISGNIINASNNYGIYIMQSGYNNIVSNNINGIIDNGFYRGLFGISAYYSSYNTYSYNNTNTFLVGIQMYSCDNNTLFNNQSYSNLRGIYVSSCNNNIFRNNNVTSNTQAGFCLGNNSNNNTIDSNYLFGNCYLGDSEMGGIYCLYSNYNTIVGNEIGTNSFRGINIYGGQYNTITNNKLSFNEAAAIYFYYSISNVVSGNIVSSNRRGIELGLNSYSNTIYRNNFFSNTEYNGYSNSPAELSYFNPETQCNEGNWWGKTTAPGFYVYNNGRYQPYDSNAANVIDSYPYLVQNGWAQGFAPQEPETLYLGNDLETGPASPYYNYYPMTRTYALTKDIIRPIVIGADNITLDGRDPNTGQPHTLSGPGWGYGIYLWRYPGFGCNGVTVRDCIVQGFNEGILVMGGVDNDIISNTVNSNLSKGIRLGGSSNGIVGNNVSNTPMEGILIEAGQNNIAMSNTVASNGYGIFLRSISGNTIISNTAVSNGYGIFLQDSASNNITGNTAGGNLFGITAMGGSINNNLTDNILAANPPNLNNTGIIFCNGANNNTVNRNIISGLRYGIYLAACTYNTIANNEINNNQNGVYSSFYGPPGFPSNLPLPPPGGEPPPWQSGWHILTDNNISSNLGYGIYFDCYIGNRVYHNNIYGNRQYNVYATTLTIAEELSYNNEGNWWGHPVSPGFYGNTPPPAPSQLMGDSNRADVRDSYPYLVQNGWLKGFLPGQPEDSTAPSGFITINNGAYATSYTLVTLTLTAADPESPVSQMRFSDNSIDWFNWMAYQPSLQWSVNLGEGIKTIYVQYRNNLGLVSDAYSDTIILDTLIPGIYAIVTPTANAVGWNNSNVTVRFEASDSGSGIESVTPQVTLATEGANQTVIGIAIDRAGNSATTTSPAVNIDKTTPQANIISLSPNPTCVPPALVVEVTDGFASDFLTWPLPPGIDFNQYLRTEYSVDADFGQGNGVLMPIINSFVSGTASTITCTAIIPLDGAPGLSDGTHTVYVRSRDVAGNWTPATVSRTFVADRTPPLMASCLIKEQTYLSMARLKIDLTTGSDSQVVTGWMTNSVQEQTFVVTITDSTSGIASVNAYLDNTPVNFGAFFNLAPYDLGAHTIRIVSVDNAGLVSEFSVVMTIVTSVEALQEAVTDIRAIISDPTTSPMVDEMLTVALETLIGNNNGAGNNGAMDKLAQGDLIAALVKIDRAIDQFRKTTDKTGYDTTDLQRETASLVQQVVAIKLDTLESNGFYGYNPGSPEWPKVMEGIDFYITGMGYYFAGNYGDAVKQFRQAQQRISEVDRWMPEVKFIYPAPGQYYINTDTPLIRVEYQDFLSAIRTDLTQVWLDGITRTSEAIITDARLTLQIPANQPLAQGSHTLTVSVTDSSDYQYDPIPGGQTTMMSIMFSVDSIPPNLSIDYPVSGTNIMSLVQLYFVVSYNDMLSGINEASFQASLNGITITDVFTVTPSGAAWYPKYDEIDKFWKVYDALKEGLNELKVNIKDRAGNPTEQIAYFYIVNKNAVRPDTTPPNLSIDYPTPSLIINNTSQLYFEVSYNDLESSVYLDSLGVWLNGISITNVFGIALDGASYYPDYGEMDKFLSVSNALKDGWNLLQAGIADNAMNYVQKDRWFYVIKSTIMPPPPPVRIGLQVYSGDKQEGLVGQCARYPLVVRAYNMNTSESLEGIQLVFEISQGGGIFMEADGYSDITNSGGLGGLLYYFGPEEMVNKVRVSVLNDTTVTPVEFRLVSYFLRMFVWGGNISEEADAVGEPVKQVLLNDAKDTAIAPVVQNYCMYDSGTGELRQINPDRYLGTFFVPIEQKIGTLSNNIIIPNPDAIQSVDTGAQSYTGGFYLVPKMLGTYTREITLCGFPKFVLCDKNGGQTVVTSFRQTINVVERNDKGLKSVIVEGNGQKYWYPNCVASEPVHTFKIDVGEYINYNKIEFAKIESRPFSYRKSEVVVWNSATFAGVGVSFSNVNSDIEGEWFGYTANGFIRDTLNGKIDFQCSSPFVNGATGAVRRVVSYFRVEGESYLREYNTYIDAEFVIDASVKIEFTDMAGNPIDYLPTVDSNVIKAAAGIVVIAQLETTLMKSALVDEPENAPIPYGEELPSPTEEGYEGTGQQSYYETPPPFPVEALFKIRVENPANTQSTTEYGRAVYANGVFIGMISDGAYFVSAKPILAYRGEYLSQEIQDMFPNYIFIDPEKITVDWLGNSKNITTLRTKLAVRKRPKGTNEWGELIAKTNPPAIENNMEVQICSIILAQPNNDPLSYYFGYSNDTEDLPSKCQLLGNLKRWDNDKNGSFSFNWTKVVPDYQDYDHTIDIKPWWVAEKVKYLYKEIQESTEPWKISVGEQVGVNRYAVDIKHSKNNDPFESPDKNYKDDSTSTSRVCGWISDKVMRVLIKGNYTSDYLKWVSTYLNCAWTMGSVPEEVERYVGTDCADLAVGAYRKWGSKDDYTNAYGIYKRATIEKNKFGKRYQLIKDATLLIQNGVNTQNIKETNLLPGDIILLGEPGNWHHTVIYVGSPVKDTDDYLDEGDEVIFANWERVPGKQYRIVLTDFGYVEKIWDYACVIRLKKP